MVVTVLTGASGTGLTKILIKKDYDVRPSNNATTTFSSAPSDAAAVFTPKHRVPHTHTAAALLLPKHTKKKD